MAQGQNNDTAKGCGCLLAIVLVIGGFATSCLRGSDDPVARPAYSLPTTTSSTPAPAYAPTSSASPALVRYECSDFSSQLEAQAAFDAGGQGHLDPDSDGLACDNYFARRSTPAPQTRSSSGEDDDSSGGSSRRRTGNSGHPCLPGERDGDGDGYCGEG